jgi:hypothetical protein
MHFLYKSQLMRGRVVTIKPHRRFVFLNTKKILYRKEYRFPYFHYVMNLVTSSNNFEALKTRRRRESDQSRSENLAGTRMHSADYTLYLLSLTLSRF